MSRASDPNVFETANAGFAQALYEEYLRDPGSVTPEWRALFESGRVGLNGGAEGRSVTAVAALPPAAAIPAAPPGSPATEGSG